MLSDFIMSVNLKQRVYIHFCNDKTFKKIYQNVKMAYINKTMSLYVLFGQYDLKMVEPQNIITQNIII